MKIPTQPQMRFLGTFGGVVAGAMHVTADTPWEMHPDGDESLHLLSGAIDVVQHESVSQTVELRPGGGCVIPRGAWHRQVVREPGDLLFITPGAGTQHREADEKVRGLAGFTTKQTVSSGAWGAACGGTVSTVNVGVIGVGNCALLLACASRIRRAPPATSSMPCAP
jgi:mannose-6-phosphate isomerase-like protein (cupin superfamily)